MIQTKVKAKRKLPYESEGSKEAMQHAREMMQKYPRLTAYFSTTNNQYAVAQKYLNAEEIFHILCVGYIKQYCKGVIVIHSPNEGKRGHVEQAKIGLMGIRSGTSDLLLINYNKVLHPLFWAELKWRSAISKDQIEFLDEQIKAGHHAAVYKRDLNKFIEDVQNWMKRD